MSFHKLLATGVALAAMSAAAPAIGQEKVVIGLSQPNVEHPYRVGGIARANAWAAENPNVELIVVDGRRDSAVQLQTLEDLLQRKVDVILVSPNDSDALAPIAEAAQRANVPVVVFDRALNVDPSLYVSYFGGDNVEMGRVAGRYIAEQIGGAGKVIQLEGTPGASATVDRKTGFEEVMAEYPDISVVSYVGHFRLHESVAAMEDAITAHRDLKAIYGHNDSMALGGAQVVEENGLTGITVVGIDGAAEGCEGVISGHLSASVFYPTMMPEALELAMQVLDGQEVPKEVMLETPLITADNTAEFCQ
jgi:ribose transport system substrate-binding protein